MEHQNQAPKFSVGIDLGTAAFYLTSTQPMRPFVRGDANPSLTAPGTVETRSQLGSFLYNHTNL